MVYTFIEQKPNYSIGLVADLKVIKNGKYLTLIHIYERGENSFHIVDINGSRFLNGTLEEAISAAKSSFDPFQDSIDKIDSMIEKRVSEARHTMHLRIASFRGRLLTQLIRLKNHAKVH